MNGRRERADVLLLAAAGLVLFGWLAPRAGLHLDDHGFWLAFERDTPQRLWELFRGYVPGRNLYIPYSYALHRLCGGSPAAMHAVGLLFDLLNPALVLLLARRLGAGPGAALAAAGLFLVWPNHGETHWWTSSIMMNVFSTTLVLCAVLAAGETRLRPRARLVLAALLYAAALFDYDQAYLLWLPLLGFALLRDPALPRRPLAAAAGFFITLDVAHLAARLLSPVSIGGRPVPRAGLVLASLKTAAAATVAPLRRTPVLDDFPGGLVAAALLALALGALWAWRCSRRWETDRPGREPALACFAGAWWLCAYAPNLLWYISPRHHYLPSVGTALAAAALASRLAARARARAVLAPAGAALFALFSLSAWSDGLAWAESTRLQDHFAAAAAAEPLTPGDVVLLAGAPKDVRTAPGFFHPREPAAALARATGARERASDVSLAPNRRGVFYGAQPQLFGEDAAPSFAPVSSAAVFALRDGRFERACSVRLDAPGLAPRVARVSGSCPGVLALRAPVALVSSRPLGRGKPAPDGPALESAALETAPGGVDLVLRWRAAAAPADFAAHARLLGADGRELYRSSYQATRREHEAYWPLYDDERPASTWKPGELVEQRHRLRLDRPLAGVPVRARLSLFAPAGRAQWRAAGKREALLEAR